MMSYQDTSSSPVKKRRSTRAVRPRAVRSFSASEIARSLKHFETWSTHQGCEQVSYSDVPAHLKADIHDVFDVSNRLPISWTVKDSETFKRLAQFASPAFLEFIKEAHDTNPSLFGARSIVDDHPDKTAELYTEIIGVFNAHCRMQQMRMSEEKWSEADYVYNVYSLLRTPAVTRSLYRVNCPISLPQPLHRANMDAAATRILNTKTVVPDGTIMIPASSIRSLSHSAKSPFKLLKGHPIVIASGNASKGSSFRYQSTPCANLPDFPGFEFASCFWEDKKPVHRLLEDAYRQNRMSTTSALRHLHSLSVEAPIFGFLWTSGVVRAHVDWYNTEDNKPLSIFSAPYSGVPEPAENTFREWHLDQPGEILAVYFLIRNIDRWTNDGFRTRIIEGVNSLRQSVTQDGGHYLPWKRVGALKGRASLVAKENVTLSTASDSTGSMLSTPPKAKAKGGRSRLRC